jgi:hypothetical protein
MSVVGVMLFIWGLAENKRLNAALAERQEQWGRMWRCNRCANAFEVID